MRKHLPMVLLIAAAGLYQGVVPAGEPAPLKVEIKELKQQSTLVLRKSVKEGEIGAALGAILPKVGQFLGSKKINPLGAPIARFLKHEGGAMDFEAGFPVPDGTQGQGDIVASSLPAGKAAVVTYFGPYEQLSKAHEFLKKWLQDNKREAAGPCWEVYMSDPSVMKAEEIRTDIVMPLK